MNITIDRFEGEFAVAELENGNYVNIPKSAIPPEAIEGDIISIEINVNKTNEKKSNINKLMNDLWTD